MEYLVNAREMKLCDTNTMEYYKVPSLVLMERAALTVVAALEKKEVRMKRVLVVCGSGNNGADGMAVARLLFLKGVDTFLYFAADKARFTAQAAQQYEITARYGIPAAETIEDTYDVIIDAMFGVGLSRKLDETMLSVIDAMNRCNAYKAAVDIPSGVCADSGMIMGGAFKADLTVTFAYRKIGMVLYPGASMCGEVRTADIGIGTESWLDKKPSVYVMTEADIAAIQRRDADGNKGTFGKVLLIAGSVNMAGAAVLAAQAAYKSGCGIVRVYTPEENRAILQTAVPEAILTVYPGKKPEMSVLNECLSWADVIVIGPGIGREEAAERIVKNTLHNAAVPLVVDADALNILAEQPEILLMPHTEMIVTPHLGEMAGLNKTAVSYIKEHLLETAEEFARTYHVICVQKDSRTVTSIPYGRTYVNIKGNSGMATAGSGDVLSGIIGSLIAQGVQPETAAPAGVFIHASAGDEQALRTGRHGLTASGIIEGIQYVLE